MVVLGFRPTELDGTEHVFSANESLPLPMKYSYRQYLPKILDQGSRPICVPCSVSTYLNWRENLANGSKSNNGIDYEEIYSSKKVEAEGMTFKEAFTYLRHHGVSSKKGNLKIKEYAMVHSFIQLKYALFMNGPCFGALPVYSGRPDFWNKYQGDRLQGYHAIAIVGYDKEGFVIRNSWGTSFGDKGYTKILYEEFGKLMEVWTIIN
jgi:hypothetical protein